MSYFILQASQQLAWADPLQICLSNHVIGSIFFFKFEQKVLHLFWFLEIGLPWKDGIDLELKNQELFWKFLKVKLKLFFKALVMNLH